MFIRHSQWPSSHFYKIQDWFFSNKNKALQFLESECEEFHWGGGSKRLHRRIDLKRNTFFYVEFHFNIVYLFPYKLKEVYNFWFAKQMKWASSKKSQFNPKDETPRSTNEWIFNVNPLVPTCDSHHPHWCSLKCPKLIDSFDGSMHD
jgi:hypothetical protein